MVKCIFDHIKDSKSLRHVEFGSSKVNDRCSNNNIWRSCGSEVFRTNTNQ